MSRYTIVVMSAAALAACALSPRVTHAGTDSRQPSAKSTIAVDRRARSLHDLVHRIVAADYQGDRPALDRLYLEAGAYLGDRAVESRVRYWRGFAKWRRAMNGANENPTPDDLVADLDIATAELRRSGDLDPDFVDARIGEMQCLGLTLFFDPKRVSNVEYVNRLRALATDLKVTAADNPRYVWAWGMAYFNAPPDKGGGPDKVIAAYRKALDGIRNGAGQAKALLDPSWGEAELYVNLAYSYLNRPSPDLALARRYVDNAIRLVPDWHYARDILRPQIEAAASKATGSSGER